MAKITVNKPNENSRAGAVRKLTPEQELQHALACGLTLKGFRSRVNRMGLEKAIAMGKGMSPQESGRRGRMKSPLSRWNSDYLKGPGSNAVEKKR